MRRTRTVVVGAGQAGLALSWHLARARHDHVVLERGLIGERWRSERWDSLTLLTPNWLTCLPDSQPRPDADGFLRRDELVTYLDAYARSFAAPVHEHVTVSSVEQSGEQFRVTTDRGDWLADHVVVATGDADLPRLPAAARAVPAGVEQLHSSSYRTPSLLAPGGVLVVGAGASGQQLALELRASGRDVVLAVGRHGRSPRRYRGRDIFDWLAELGDLDLAIDDLPDPVAARRTPSIALSGRNGGETLDLAVLQDAGVTLAGHLTGFSDAHALFEDDLRESVAAATARMSRLLERIDAHVHETRAPAPPPERIDEPVLQPTFATLDLRRAGIGTVLFATGYRRAYPWLHVPVLDDDGELVHRHGITPVAGLYALGLRFQRTRKSHFVGGVGEDAGLLAELLLNAGDERIAADSLRSASDGVSTSRTRRGGRRRCRSSPWRREAAGTPRPALAER
jgi:putative flavoprotein involved in K+ transport